MSKIAFINSDNRRYNIERSLALIKSEILTGLKYAKNVVIKPNCVTDTVALAATNWEALDVVLEFIAPHVKNQIILAEGTGTGNTLNAFENFGYMRLRDKYDIALVDLNEDEYQAINLLDANGQVWPARVAKTILESDYLISVSPPKTHDCVVYTGAVKNVAVGSLVRPKTKLSSRLSTRLGLGKNDKMMIHQGPKYINENIKRLFEHIPLKLAVIDGFEAMEGNGPIYGDMVPSHFAIASSDALAADWLAHTMMGIHGSDIGYLALLNKNTTEHFIIGDDWRNRIMKFKMHANFETIRKWR